MRLCILFPRRGDQSRSFQTNDSHVDPQFQSARENSNAN